MMLRARTLVTSLALAVPAAALVTTGIDLVRKHDLSVVLDRVVRSQINDAVRERCESDPNWFLTGPLEGRPRRTDPPVVDPDALPPRPKVIDQPFELFAFDEQFRGSSSAAPRFPSDFRRDLLRSSAPVTDTFDTPDGAGVQTAIPTGWIGSPCMYFLGRLHPAPNQMSARLEWFAGLIALFAAVAWGAQAHLTSRARRLAGDLQASIKSGFASIAPDRLKDELSSVTFMFNDTATELHQRKTRIDDQDEALRRYVTYSVTDVAPPIGRVEHDLAELAGAAATDGARTRAYRAIVAAHQAGSRLENLAAAAQLRMSAERPRATVDLRALLERVTERHVPLAKATGVALTLSVPPQPITLDADEALLERAIGNLVDNGILYNNPGGGVHLTLTSDAARGFVLKVTDTGRGATDDDMKGLTAVRRFRGDESHNRRPHAPGLGLALAREVTDRAGLQLELRRPPAGGFEAEITRRGPTPA